MIKMEISELKKKNNTKITKITREEIKESINKLKTRKHPKKSTLQQKY